MNNQNDFIIFLNDLEAFITQNLVPREREIREQNAIPEDLIHLLKQKKAFGYTIPPEFGGLGLSITQEIEAVFKWGLTIPAFHALIGTNHGIGTEGIILFGTPEQKSEFLPKLATGQTISSFALTEPESGSDVSNLRTTAQKNPAGWVIQGKKCYISNAPIAGLFTVIVNLVDGDNHPALPTAFLVKRNTPGLTVSSPSKKMGLDGADVAEVNFNHCLVDQSCLLGKIGAGLEIAYQLLNKGRLRIAALSVGIANRLIKDSLNYSLSRQQFNRPIADFQLIRAMLADSQAEYFAGLCMVREAAKFLENNLIANEVVSCAKLFCTEMVCKVADRAVQIHGGQGYLSARGIEGFYRDVRLFRIYEGTNQIQQLIISKEILNRYKKENVTVQSLNE